MGRRLGQHFLIRKSILQRIAVEVCPEGEPLVIEIGPGKGALTEHLLTRAARVVAIETDAQLAEHLAKKFDGVPNLSLVLGDVLETDLGQWGPAVVAGNLPYYITSPILSKVLGLGSLLRDAVFLVQREVADRLTAQPGSRQYGFLTVKTKLFTEPEILFVVPPSAFRPPPKVHSAVVRVRPHSGSRQWGIEDPERFLEFAGRCFRLKRKTIRNNLVSSYGKAPLETFPEASLRAEQLSIAQLAALYHRLNG